MSPARGRAVLLLARSRSLQRGVVWFSIPRAGVSVAGGRVTVNGIGIGIAHAQSLLKFTEESGEDSVSRGWWRERTSRAFPIRSARIALARRGEGAPAQGRRWVLAALVEVFFSEERGVRILKLPIRRFGNRVTVPLAGIGVHHAQSWPILGFWECAFLG